MDDRRQRGEVCPRPSGLRRLTAGGVATERRSEGFCGLPEGATHPAALLGALKAAAPFIGLASRFVHALDFLFRFTQPQDWEEGSRPIVWPSAELQQLELGLSATQVKLINRHLIDRGLMTARDSPNGKRYGRRNERGAIIEAYGFDLSPLAGCYSEFIAAAEEGRAQREALRRLRRRVTIARKGLQQIAETAAEYQLASPELVEHMAAMRVLTAAARQEETPTGLAQVVDLMERRHQQAMEWLNQALNSVETDPKGPISRPHITLTTQPPYLDRDTVIARRECSRVEAAEESSLQAPVKPAELVTLVPRLGNYIAAGNPTWPEILDATEWLRQELGVSRALWGRACQVMGRVPAAVALAIVTTKAPTEIRTTPAGYFHGMIGKAEQGELHLDRTLWKLRKSHTIRAGAPGAAISPAHGARSVPGQGYPLGMSRSMLE